MPLADRKDPYSSLHFFVEIDGIDQGGFSEVSGLEVKTDVFEYEEGGLNDHKHKLPGRSSYTNITLKWGSTDSDALWKWYEKVIQGKVERKNVSIVQYDAKQTEVRRWNLREAYPVKWGGPAYNASSNAVSIETLELAHHGFEVQ
jgi:phage tail-like protein